MGTIAEQIYEIVKTLSDEDAQQVLNFVEFLKAKNTAEVIYQKAREMPEAEAREVLHFMEFLWAKRERGEIRR